MKDSQAPASTKDDLIESFWDADPSGGIDLAFSFDTTGSMQPLLGIVRAHVKEVCTALMDDIKNIRIAIITHGDFCDDSWVAAGMIQILDFTENKDTVIRHISTVGNTGGEGAHAAYEYVLHKARFLKWRPASAKALVLIGDVVPNAPSRTVSNFYWRTEMNHLYRRGVKIYGVQAYPSTFSLAFYQELARRTGGAFLPLEQFPLITDMMKAITHREAGTLSEFKRKNVQKKDMNFHHMIQSLERKLSDARVRDPGEAWWDIKYDKGFIVYEEKKGKYMRCTDTRRLPQPIASKGGMKAHAKEAVKKTLAESGEAEGYSQRTGGKIMDTSQLTSTQLQRMHKNREAVTGAATADSGYRLIQVKHGIWEFVDKATAEKIEKENKGKDKSNTKVKEEKVEIPQAYISKQEQDIAAERKKQIQATEEKAKALHEAHAEKVTLSKDAQRNFAVARLMRDLKEIHKTPLYGVSALPLENDMTEWHANITGPKGTEYDGVTFHLVLKFPSSYPRKPPTVRICTRLLHPNVFGPWVCLDMLEIGAFGTGAEADRINTGWSSAYSVLSILLQLQTFLFTDTLEDDDEDAYIYKLPVHVQSATRLAHKYTCDSCQHGCPDAVTLKRQTWPPFPTDVPSCDVGDSDPEPVKPKRKKLLKQPRLVEDDSLAEAPLAPLAPSFPPAANQRDNGRILPLSFFTPGMPVEGTVRRVKEGLGAFVDVGAPTLALLHIAEMSTKYISSISEVTSEGKTINAYVKNVDTAKARIGLTIIGDPLMLEWKVQGYVDIDLLKEGDRRIGKVTRKESYGVFLNIGAYATDGAAQQKVTGMLHISALSTAKHQVVWSAGDLYAEGQMVAVEVRRVGMGENGRPTIDLTIPSSFATATTTPSSTTPPSSARAAAVIYTSGICSLDLHTLYNIMKYLNPITMGKLGTTCRMMRKIADDGISYLWERNEIVCFHSKRHFTEDTLGIGVNLESKMNGKLAYITCTYDLVSYSAFKDEEVRKASYKEQFSHWVPVFIEPGHGRRAMTLAKESMAKICTECYGSFEPWMVLEIMPKLMNTMVVSVMSGKLYGSIMALEGYCGFHHMFLNLMREYPELQAKADEIIKKFINDPHKRHKKEVPALGEFLPLLTVTETYSWEDVAVPYLLEMFDRNVLWTVKKYNHLALPSVTEAQKRKRLTDTFEATTVSNHLLMFHVYFLKKIARPESMTLKQVSDLLDLRYGRPTYAMKDQLLKEVKRIRKLKTWDAFFQKINVPKPKDLSLVDWLHSSLDNSTRKRYHRQSDYVTVQRTLNTSRDDDDDDEYYDAKYEKYANKGAGKYGGRNYDDY